MVFKNLGKASWKKALYVLVLMLLWCHTAHAQKKPFDYVNTFLGTQGGNTYPGAQAPFGMLSVSPGTTFRDYDDAYARPGYQYNEKEIRGIALTHFSGVGCHAMQDVMFMPATVADSSPVYNRNAYKSTFSHAEEQASPGYYALRLASGNISLQFAAAVHSCIGEIRYPASGDKYFVLMPTNSANGISDGSIDIDTVHNTVSGFIATGGFCWRDPADRPYRIYFTMAFDQPIKMHGTWKGRNKLPGNTNITGKDMAAYISFAGTASIVHMKAAISSVSVANAAANLDAEITGWDLALLRRQTAAQWASYLDKIQVSGGTDAEQYLFYTAIYRNLLQPNIWQDVNGEYMGFDDKVHVMDKGKNKYVNFSLWDTYRTTAYLQAMLAPKATSDMITSLLLDAQQGGAFPNWSMNNKEYGVMNGYSAIPFIANAYAMGAQDIDLAAVKEMMKKVSRNYYACQGIAGWANLEDYKQYGYVPVDKHGFGTSMTEEYGIDDYALAKLCEASGDTAMHYFFRRSQQVFNLYNPSTGLLQARNADGKFVTPFNDSTTTGFNEGNAIQYLWSVPHSMKKLINMAGGRAKVEARLDKFVAVIENGWAPDKPHYWIGNEPCFGAAYVYNYLQVPWKAQQTVRRIMNGYYQNAPDGLPGDDDAGAMSALYVFSAMGLYPYLPGTGGFTITGPLFTQTTIRLDNGHTFIIDGHNAATDAPFIQSMRLNGKTASSLWLDWKAMQQGGVLDFQMGNRPNRSWGIDAAAMPPSYTGK